ncbi:hypothetical protein N7470_002800 [Penicillium chermesinum]|nr:hypothetical protein N7470_002800 [Penicillium chermesinum]
MAHSKRNTSLPHFTAYERSLLRSTWGSKRSVIGRDSFLPFGSCKLCLQPARAPVVACATNGDLFCRECAINDLLAQRQEIKRLEREKEEAKKALAEDEERALEEAKRKELADFELVSMGLEGKSGAGTKRKAEESEALEAFKKREVLVEGKRRKVFELDAGQMARVTRTSKSALPSFWVPSLTPSTDANEIVANKSVKMAPICPGSSEEDQHTYSLKSLVEVHFNEEKSEDGTTSRTCPSCKKTLNNGLKAILAKPCGHVICSPCVRKFMTPFDPDPHRTKGEQAFGAADTGKVLCYVCETDVSEQNSTDKGDDHGKEGSKKKSKKKDKEAIKPGLVAISSEGTGFAGGGGNVATKKGVAFQC